MTIVRAPNIERRYVVGITMATDSLRVLAAESTGALFDGLGASWVLAQPGWLASGTASEGRKLAPKTTTGADRAADKTAC